MEECCICGEELGLKYLSNTRKQFYKAVIIIKVADQDPRKIFQILPKSSENILFV